MRNHIKNINAYREGRTKNDILQQKLISKNIRDMLSGQPS